MTISRLREAVDDYDKDGGQQYPEGVLEAVDDLLTEEEVPDGTLRIVMRIGKLEVSVTRPMLAELPTDNEENMARLADQLVRAIVRRHYTK